MHCKQARQLIDRLPQPAQPSPELTQHTVQCSRCAKFHEERTALYSALATLRAETASFGPSTRVEQRVLAALSASAFNPHRTHHHRRWITASTLAFAALLIAAALFIFSRNHNGTPIAAIPHEEPFTAMPYVVPAARDEHIIIVRTQISSQIVQNAGLQIQDDAESIALADLVLGDGGRLLGLRLVSNAHPTSEKRAN